MVSGFAWGKRDCLPESCRDSFCKFTLLQSAPRGLASFTYMMGHFKKQSAAEISNGLKIIKILAFFFFHWLFYLEQ